LERLNALIRMAAMARRGVEAVEIVRAREMNVNHGCPALFTCLIVADEIATATDPTEGRKPHN